MKEQKLNGWEEFEAGLKDVRREYEQSPNSQKTDLLFRGQENSSWPLQTTLDRKQERMLFKNYYRMIAKIRPQIETLTRNEWSIPDYPEVEKEAADYYALSIKLWSGRFPGYAYMAYLRHHGFPSPLLDWSRSPYVAAYFAFNKTLGANDRVAIYVFGETVHISGNRMAVINRLGPYVKTHRRHVLQQSEYTLCTGFDDEWFFEKYDTVFEDHRHQQGLCWKFTIPATERSKVLKQLDEYNLNAFSLFESEDSLMETLSTREFCFQKVL